MVLSSSESRGHGEEQPRLSAPAGLSYGTIALWAVFLLGIVYFQHRLWFAHGSLSSLAEIRGSIAEQSERNASLLLRNEQLHAEVEELKYVDDAIAERAREQLGLVGKNETFYIVTD